MRIWIRAQDVRIWKVVEQENHVPMKKSTTKDGDKSIDIEIPKLENEYNDDDWKKILRSLTPKWNSKANAIVEGVHYQNETLTYDQLRGNLLTYEITILDPQSGKTKKKSLALRFITRRRK
ncbi:hypothetical protein PIB30_049187 [Stylosanthes scabra]|uniref:Uncharacterized protein n=1 Tax=Stylosanthes scabra TaxID=79078 RepID=A0ABU6UGM9_9FABA|nr:hypothetical protein [Stylosanthes scabra]